MKKAVRPLSLPTKQPPVRVNRLDDDESEACSICGSSNSPLTNVHEKQGDLDVWRRRPKNDLCSKVITLRSFLVRKDESGCGGCPYCVPSWDDADDDHEPCRVCPPCLSSLFQLLTLRAQVTQVLSRLKARVKERPVPAPEETEEDVESLGMLEPKEEDVDPMESGWEDVEEINPTEPEEDGEKTECTPEVGPLLGHRFVDEEVDPNPKRVQNEDRILCELCGVSLIRKSLKRHNQRVHTVQEGGPQSQSNPPTKAKRGKSSPCHSSQKRVVREDASLVLGSPNSLDIVKPMKRKRNRGTRITCPICNRTFKTEAWRRSHTHPDHNDPSSVSYQCAECPRICPSQNSLQSHIMTSHSGERVCEICGSVCPSAARLRYHMVMKHRTQEERALCPTCGLQLPSFRERLNHQRVVHKGLPSTQCYFCGRFFLNFCTLRKHFSTHTLEKPFRCPKCRKEFASPQYLKRHLTFVCGGGDNVEGRAELKRKQAEYYRRSSVNRRYVCHICGRDFAVRSHLKGHLAVVCGNDEEARRVAREKSRDNVRRFNERKKNKKSGVSLDVSQG